MNVFSWVFLIAAILLAAFIRIDGYRLTEMELLVIYWKHWVLFVLLCILSALAALITDKGNDYE